MLEHELAKVEPLLAHYGYGAVFAAVLVEGFGLPAPGQTLLVAGAVLAARGELSLAALLATAAAASTAGTLAGWAIGHTGGRRLLQRLGGPRTARVERLFERWGAGLVLFGRFVDGARQLAGITAGSLGMRLGPFLVWNALGAVLWTAFWGIGAWAFTRDFHAIAAAAHRSRWWLWGATLAAVLALLVWLVAGSRRSRTPP